MPLLPALRRMHDALEQKAKDWDKVIKIGRTHLMDATPLRLGQEFGGFARQLQLSIVRADVPRGMLCWSCLWEEPLLAPGINTHPEFGWSRCQSLGIRKRGSRLLKP